VDLELLIGEEAEELLYRDDLVNNDPWALAQSVGITILSDKDLYAVFVDNDEGIVAAALFTSYYDHKYSFDTVVGKKYQGMGLGSQLIDLAMEEFKWIESDDPEAILELDVVNERIVPFLERKYDLKIKKTEGGHIIMGSFKHPDIEIVSFHMYPGDTRIVVDLLLKDKRYRYLVPYTLKLWRVLQRGRIFSWNQFRELIETPAIEFERLDDPVESETERLEQLELF